MHTIKPFEPSHLDAVVLLSLRAWAPVFDSIRRVLDPALYEFFYQPDWQTSQRQAVADVCSSRDNSVWVSLEGDTVTGFVAVKMNPEAKSGEIYMVAVDPGFQRKGIADQLTEHALQQMRLAGMTLATVNTGADPGHEPARRCYEKAGFRPWPSVQYFKAL